MPAPRLLAKVGLGCHISLEPGRSHGTIFANSHFRGTSALSDLEAQKRIDEKRRAEREALRRTLEEVLRGCVIEIG